ncbi:MAG TPA: DUF72 domain-containing protein, partial [bacterium]|nr:DUF72 domain-containing protein [bacterium]
QEATLKKWLEATDEGFLFSMQANRLITHSRKLRDVDGLLHAFLDRISTMGSQLAPTLFQLPHSMEKDTALLRDFLALLPGDRESVMEFRHASWFDDEVLMCLREHRVGYCIVSAPRLPVRIEVTAPFAYIRLHGKRRWFTDNYTDEDLEWWAREVRHILDQGTRVFAYFANDEDAAAVFNAKKFEQLLSP